MGNSLANECCLFEHTWALPPLEAANFHPQHEEHICAPDGFSTTNFNLKEANCSSKPIFVAEGTSEHQVVHFLFQNTFITFSIQTKKTHKAKCCAFQKLGFYSDQLKFTTYK